MGIAIAATSSHQTGNQANGQSGTQSAGSPVTLQAQLDRCTKQLSDWVDCSSGKTPEGKQIIAALQAKISDIKQQIQQGQNAPATDSQAAPASPPASLAIASLGSVGTILNTQA